MLGSSRGGTTETWQWSNGTLTADGTEQALLDTDDFRWTVLLYVNVDNMQGGDTIVFRTYIRMSSGGAWVLVDLDTYTGADGGLVGGEVMADEGASISPYGVKITFEQSAGVNRDFDWVLIEWL